MPKKHKVNPKVKITLWVAIIVASGPIIAALVGIMPDMFKKDHPSAENVQNININGEKVAHVQITQTINYNCDLPAKTAAKIEELEEVNAEKEQLIKEMCRKYDEIKAELERMKATEAEAAEALAKLEQGDYEEAEKLFTQRLKGKKASASAVYYLGNIKLLKLDYRKAAEYYTKAAQLAPDNSEYQNAAGVIWNKLGKYKVAIAYFEKALVIDKKTRGERHPNVAIRLNNLGAAWKSLGEYNKAIEYYEQALSIWQEAYGDKHPNIAVCLNNLGFAWKSLGEYNKAIGYYEQALSIWQEAYGERHPQVAIGLNNLGVAWKSLGECNKAIVYYEQALSIDKEYYGERHPKIAIRLNNLGVAWKSLGEYKKAIGYYEQALAIDKEYYGERHPAVARDLNNLGFAWESLRKYAKARQCLQQAYDMRVEFLGAEHHYTIGTKAALEALGNK